MSAAGLLRGARLAVALCALAAPPVQAAEEEEPPVCVCPARVKPLESGAHYDLIFFGQASILGVDTTREDQDEDDGDEFVEFSVEGLWKGPSQRRLRVHTSSGDPRCAFRFVLGKRYLVFASLEDVAYSNRYRTSICERTTEASQALPDLAVLGPPLERFEP